MPPKPKALVSTTVSIPQDIYKLAQSVADTDDVSYNKYMTRILKADLKKRGVLKVITKGK